MTARVLHVLPSMVVGGAQRTAATLARIPRFESRVVLEGKITTAIIEWADIIVVHAWRVKRDRPELNVPAWISGMDGAGVIIFNHDWEGSYQGPADLVLVYSEFAARHWRGRHLPTVLHGGIGLERFSRVAQARSYALTCRTVGRLSTMHPGKIDVATLSYWPRLQAEKYLIGGTGSQLSCLRAAATDSRFEFAGEIEPSRTHSFLARLDVFLYDTVWHIESFCYVVLEAMAAGCVVVASRRGAISELVADGTTGILFDHPDEAVQVTNALLDDEEWRAKLGRGAFLSAQHRSAERMQTAFANHLQVVGRKR